MNSSAQILIAQVNFHNSYVMRMFSDLTDQELNLSNSVIKNNAGSIISHLLNARIKLLELSGFTEYANFAHVNPMLVNREISEAETGLIAVKWKEIHEILFGVLSKIDDENLDRQCLTDVPFENKSVRGVFAAYMTHEAYHCGQLGIIYSFAGKGRLMSV